MATQLGSFGDWPAFAERHHREDEAPGSLTRGEIRGLLALSDTPRALDPRTERAWERDGVQGEEVSWSVGYGQRTVAWLLRPAGARGRLPGILAFHGHDDVKRFGKEKIADGPDGAPPSALRPVRSTYGERAFANELARAGYAVLVPDVFLWGSRRFDRAAIEATFAHSSQFEWLAPLLGGAHGPKGPSDDEEAEHYDRLADLHEDVVERLCRVLGTSLAGVVAGEDAVALDSLRSRADVDPERIGVIGCSGGGARAALLGAAAPEVRAVAVICMMSTYREMLEGHVATHTWMLFPPGLTPRHDWPDIVLSRAPGPLLVQYAREDRLFPLAGMQAAHDKIAARYAELGQRDAYVGEFYDGGHRFDRPMQEAAFGFLRSALQ